MSDPTGIAVFGYSHKQRMFDSTEQTESKAILRKKFTTAIALLCKTETMTDFFKPKFVSNIF